MTINTKPDNSSKSKFLRSALMLGGIVIVGFASLWLYTTSGRFIATDNAYIRAAKILITPQVSGLVSRVEVKDNQNVRQGDLLFTIDADSYQIALEEAQADLDSAYTQIERLKAQFRQKQQALAQAKIEADFSFKELQRKTSLGAAGVLSEADLDESQRQRDFSTRSVASLEEELNGLLAELAGSPDISPEQHPLYQKELAALHEAELNLRRTEVRSPSDGMIGTAPNIGEFAQAGVPLLNLVGTDEVWIEANYKETELTNLAIGQPVSIEIDTYPGREWVGHVESISPATGSEFSILPAQNATGNWVKVVQRIAVRIAVDPQSDEALLLRSGMSTHVTVDTGHYPHSFGSI